MDNTPLKIALVGNPNTGKSTLFNQLTGLKQKVGNYPGITVDKKLGFFDLPNGRKVEVLDLPGTYSLYPRSKDEELVMDVFSNPLNEHYPDIILVIADASNLRRNLLVFEQIKDLGLHVLLVVNMIDELEKSDITLDLKSLEVQLEVKALATNARKGVGVSAIKKELQEFTAQPTRSNKVKLPFNYNSVWEKELKEVLGLENPYLAWHWIAQPHLRRKLAESPKQKAENLSRKFNINISRTISQEIVNRYQKIDKVVDTCIVDTQKLRSTQRSEKLDHILLHKYWGFASLLLLLFLMFQSIFTWASFPMDIIDEGLSNLNNWLANNLPSNFFFDLITQGVLPGISGILIFIPQIALLFFFIAVFEESGYMARVVYLMDKLLRPFGLNGKSVVPLISGYACAIPAVMATRSIENVKERLATMLVVPFMTCSARLPVYTILIALIVPASATIFGIFNTHGILLLGLYFLAAVTALISGWVLKKTLGKADDSFLIMELPDYKMPRWSNVGLTMLQKTKSFVFGAGKIILSISIILWLLSSFGPSDKFYNAEAYLVKEKGVDSTNQKAFEQQVASFKLENSFIGNIGKFIEPAIKPLGYDWKIGISLLTSFAAREVFVGTMATIYSLDGDETESTIKEKMANDIVQATGEKRFSLATCISLLLFYAFAMQCMSTLAIVKKETRSWKWPIIQFIAMTLLAYVMAYIGFKTFS